MRLWIPALALLLAALPQPALAWWKTEWPYRKALTVDTSPTGINVSGAVGRTLVLVRLHSGNFTFNEALENGADLRFVASDDKTPLAYHIENFDAQTGVANIWVSLPTVSGGEKATIFMYYGNKSAPAAQDVPGSFDSDYVAAFHFNEKPGEATRDKTANGNNASNAPAGINSASIIGPGARFAPGGAITIPDAPSLAIEAGKPFSFSAWVKADALAPAQALLRRGAVTIGLAGGYPYVDGAGARVQATTPVTQGQWAHVAVTADGTDIKIFVNGVEAGAAKAALPALTGALSIGGADDAPFTGELDEVRLSKVARNPAEIMASAVNQGSADKLLAFGQDEEQGGGADVFLFVAKETPFLDWVVIGVCLVMLAIATLVMWTKAAYINRVVKANTLFKKRFNQMHEDLVSLDEMPDVGGPFTTLWPAAPLYQLHPPGTAARGRRRAGAAPRPLSAEAIEAMRSAVDAQVVTENQRFDKWMVLLTIAIAGGPFIGLLGTVLGVMKTFGGVAMAGDVNINAIAPGIAAALLATIAGLACAIPALFGYNYLNSRITALSDEMRVFVDRLITRLAEMQAERSYDAPPPAKLAAE